jgi:uncharacterized membrane protein
VTLVSLAFLALGVALIAFGTARAQGPYRRYQALKEQDANVARYGAWRGGVRSDPKTGSSPAMRALRRQVQLGGLMVIVGFVCVALGFILR